jgi:hypothetical protein
MRNFMDLRIDLVTVSIVNQDGCLLLVVLP